MWSLKIKYKHSDCVYTDIIEKLGISVQYHTLISNNRQRKYAFCSSLQIVKGRPSQVDKYFRYLKGHKNLVNIERYGNVFHVQFRMQKREYSKIYDPRVFDSSPSYLEKGYEIIESASWDKSILDQVLKGFQSAKTKLYCEVLHFRKVSPAEVCIARIRSKLPLQQARAFRAAQSAGYYNFPRETDLDLLAKRLKISKSTLRENLRKAESKVIPRLISDWSN